MRAGRCAALAVLALAACGDAEVAVDDMSPPPPDLAGADLALGPQPLGASCKTNGDCLSRFCHYEPPNTPNSVLVCGCKDGELPDAEHRACVCDPKTCTSCCDDAAGRCGRDPVSSGNNCGARGQACFHCASNTCINSSTQQMDYCADPCGDTCMGCCNSQGVCVLGDEDSACGAANAACAACAAEQHCTDHACLPPIDAGAAD